MPFRLSVEDGIIVARFSGVVTGGDFAEFAPELLALEARQPLIPSRLADLSETTSMEVHFTDIAALAERRRDRRFPNAFKSAILAPSPVQFGLARMFQTLNDHPQITIQVFTEATEAWAWVRATDQAAPPAS